MAGAPAEDAHRFRAERVALNPYSMGGAGDFDLGAAL